MPNYSVEIKKGLVKYANTLSFGNLEIYIEGNPRPTVQKEQRLEVRVNGPIVEEQAGSTKVEVEFNVLVHTVRNDINAYDHNKAVDKAIEFLAAAIAWENPSRCLRRISAMQTTYYGYTKDNEIEHSTVEATYEWLE